ncbi:MAG: PIN domain-containing protein [Candidatus Methanofastidiosia archaeon]
MVEGEYLIDTNIFLEVLLEQDNKDSCLNLLTYVEKGEIQAIVTSFALHSIAIILEKLKDIDSYRDFLEVVVASEGLMTYSTTPNDEIEVCAISRKFNLTFDDSLHYFVVKAFELNLINLDSDFDKTDIVRMHPKDVVASLDALEKE